MIGSHTALNMSFEKTLCAYSKHSVYGKVPEIHWAHVVICCDVDVCSFTFLISSSMSDLRR